MRKVNIGEPEFRWDEDDPKGFRAGLFRPGPDLGAERLGLSVYEIPAGVAARPRGRSDRSPSPR